MKMSKWIVGAFLANLVIATMTAQTSVDPYSPDPNPIREIDGWLYAWGDEFNTDGPVDETLWQGEKGFIRGNEKQYYQLKNAEVLDGRLLITGKKERVKNEFYNPSSSDYRKNTEYSEYTSASLMGKERRHFLFGRIEVRAKIDPANGTFPAIWTCGYNKNWPKNGEIDIMEYYLVNTSSGYKPVLTSNFCVGGDDSKDEWAQNWESVFTDRSYYEAKDPDWMKKYHVYRMDWDEEKISLYVDDELRNFIVINDFRNYDGSIAFHNPQFMILNLAIKDHGAGISDDSKFEVDYFRVYQKIVDTEKPSVVTGLTASNISSTSCKLTWAPSTDNVGVYRYDIYKNGMADGYFVASSTTTSFVATGLTPNTQMTFKVRALDKNGNYSDENTALTVRTLPMEDVSNGTYVMTNYNSGKVLSPLNASSQSGAQIVQVTDTDNDVQKWQFTDLGTGYWSIKNVANGLYLDVEGASTADGAKSIQGTYTGGNSQQWSLVKSGNYYAIVNRNGGKYLDVSDVSQAENWPVILWKSNGGKNQLWDLSKREASGIEKSVETSRSFQWYPNPVSDFIVCSSGQHLGSVTIEVLTLTGQTIAKEKFETALNNRVDLSSVPPGIYLLKIHSNQAVESFTIIKK